jgi:hypothetical protein
MKRHFKALLGIVAAVVLSGVLLFWVQGREQRAVVTQLESLNAYVIYASFDDCDPRKVIAQIVGERNVSRVVMVCGSDRPVTDSDLRLVATLNDAVCLELAQTRVTDLGCEHLQNLKGLMALSLDGTGITDASLVHIGKLTKLERLSLTNTRITDKGLPSLYGLNHLRGLRLKGTDVTIKGVRELEKHLPEGTELDVPSGYLEVMRELPSGGAKASGQGCNSNGPWEAGEILGDRSGKDKSQNDAIPQPQY